MRQRLVNEIRNSFAFEGYTFYQGFTENINGQTLRLPLVWLTPVDLVSLSGRSEGLAEYDVTLYLMVAKDKYTEDEKELVWGEMEKLVAGARYRIFGETRSGKVVSIQCYPNEYAFTGYRELSLQVKMRVTMMYCYGT